MFVYHIKRNIETRYLNVFSALESLKHPEPMAPWVPNHTMLGEDETTPRICVAASIEACFMGCTLYPFRRCCARVPGMDRYRGVANEAYPIIVDVFDVATPYFPTVKEVPDALDTGEMWLLEESTPVSREMFWLTTDAIEAYGKEYCPGCLCPWEDFHVVEYVQLLTTEEAMDKGLDHPWLNRRGHILGASNNIPIAWSQELHCLADGWPLAA